MQCIALIYNITRVPIRVNPLQWPLYVYVIGYPKLKNNVKDLICNLDNTLVHLPYTWISATTVMHNMTDIAYAIA